MDEMTITKKNLKLLQNASQEFDILSDTIKSFLNEYASKKMDIIQKTLKLSFETPLVLENLKKIESLSPDVHALSQRLDGLNPKFSEQIVSLNKIIDTTFSKYREQQDNEFEKKMAGFEKIGDKHKLTTIWSEYDISPSDMKKPFSNQPVDTLIYESWGPTQKIKIGKISSWLDMWKFAEQAIKASGDTHHIFIEGFVEDKKKPGQFKLVTGS